MKMIIGGFFILIGVAWVVLLGLMALLEALFGGPKAEPAGFLNMMFIGAIIAAIGLPLFSLAGARIKRKLPGKRIFLPTACRYARA